MVKERTPAALALEKRRGEILAGRDPSRPCITVCAGTGCTAGGGLDLCTALKQAVSDQGAQDKVDVKITGCRGFCEQGPLVTVLPDKIFYTRVQPRDAAEIVQKTILEGQVVERLLYKDPVSGERCVHED